MAVHEVSEDYPAFLMNTTETQKLASDPEEDVSDLELAISSLRGVTFAAASAGIVANVLAFMSARRLGTKTSGLKLMICRDEKRCKAQLKNKGRHPTDLEVFCLSRSKLQDYLRNLKTYLSVKVSKSAYILGNAY